MAAKKTEPALPTDLDDLLDFDGVTEAVKSAPEAEKAEPEVPAEELAVDSKPEPVKEPEETPEAKRIRELQEELAKPAPEPTLAATTDIEGRPLPEEELTEEQRTIRQLEDQLAKKKAKELETAPEQLDTATGKETILIHIVEDGFTAQGRTWFKGQEIEFVVGGRAHKETKDRNGDSWLDLDESGQIQKYGVVYFRRGPWPGLGYSEDASLREERKRNRAAPILTS